MERLVFLVFFFFFQHIISTKSKDNLNFLTITIETRHRAKCVFETIDINNLISFF